MPFVKLDTNILNSTLWFEMVCREVFITALLMAEPYDTKIELPQLEVRTLNETSWKVPAGWYGFVPAAGVGIIRRAMIENEESGLEALEKLGNPEVSSRSQDFEGRRLVRVDGGYIVLNYFKYRDWDYTSAERSRRYREKRKRHGVASPSHAVASRDITQADSRSREQSTEAETKEELKAPTSLSPALVPSAEDIYRAYPLKKEKPQALAAIKGAMKRFGGSFLLERTTAYANARGGDLSFVPYPQKWFKREGFNDDPSTWLNREQPNASIKPPSERELRLEREMREAREDLERRNTL